MRGHLAVIGGHCGGQPIGELDIHDGEEDALGLSIGGEADDLFIAEVTAAEHFPGLEGILVLVGGEGFVADFAWAGAFA